LLKRNGTGSESKLRWRVDLLEAILFIHIGFFAGWPFNCLYRGMNFWMILMSVKVIVTVIAFARGGGQDARFQDDKLDFRG
jgi:hypothetical protein